MPGAAAVACRVSGAAAQPAGRDRCRPRTSRLPLRVAHGGLIEAAEFAGLLDPLGPFEAAPRLAVAVSGGADSMALALLADAWVRARGGSCIGLIVDHGLRAVSGEEASLTSDRLSAHGIGSHFIVIGGLHRGPRMAERARAARYAALERFCAEAGILHLLLGHHAADQAETVAMRMLRGSGPDGLAGMAALVETAFVRLIRPLLSVPPVRLRATLLAMRVGWVEDPSNRDPAAQRARLRALRRDPDGDGVVTAAAVRAAAARGRARQETEAAAAAWLGRHAFLHPDGYVLLEALPTAPAPLAALLRIVAGAGRPPAAAAVAAWLERPRAATLGGVMLRPAGRLAAPGAWLLHREPAAMAPDVAALPGCIWDRRRRLLPGNAALPPGSRIGPADGPPLRQARGGVNSPASEATIVWWPPVPLAGGGFVVNDPTVPR